MSDPHRIELLDVVVGGMSRSQLTSALSDRGVLLNPHAETLLEDAVFDDPRRADRRGHGANRGRARSARRRVALADS